MTHQLILEIQKKTTKKLPALESGMTVRIHQKIKEGEKERVQIFEGLIIKISSGHGTNKAITVRKVVEGIGVEKVFPLQSPTIVKIEVKKMSKVRRAKIYYMRERFGKSARLKGRFLSDKDLEASVEELVVQVEKEEAAKAQEEGTALPEAAPVETPVVEAAAEAPKSE